MTDKAAWQGQVGQTWAAQWQRTDRSFAALTAKLLAEADRRPFGKALDIGCGAGELALALARSQPQTQIIGVDVSVELIDAAASRIDRLGNVSFELGDAATWTRSGFAPDLLISRHGVMFFDDPVGAFSHLHSIASGHARLLFSCFRSPAHNAWANDTVALLPPGAVGASDPHAPGPFAFADQERVGAILAQAGWRDIAFEAVDFGFVVGSGEDPVEDAMGYFARIGPVARAAAELSDADRRAFRSRLREHLAAHASDSVVALPASAWIVVAAR